MDITNSNRDKLSKLKNDLFKNSNYIKKNYEYILDSLKSISTKYIISTTFKPIEVFIVAGGIYLFMTFIIHNVIKFLEKKYSY